MFAGSHSAQKIHLKFNAMFTSNQNKPGHVCESHFDMCFTDIVVLRVKT